MRFHSGGGRQLGTVARGPGFHPHSLPSPSIKQVLNGEHAQATPNPVLRRSPGGPRDTYDKTQRPMGTQPSKFAGREGDRESWKVRSSPVPAARNCNPRTGHLFASSLYFFYP